MKVNRAALAAAQIMAMAGTVVDVPAHQTPAALNPGAKLGDRARYTGTTRDARRNKYRPHIGLQEQLRRRSQREAGTLNVYPGGRLHA